MKKIKKIKFNILVIASLAFFSTLAQAQAGLESCDQPNATLKNCLKAVKEQLLETSKSVVELQKQNQKLLADLEARKNSYRLIASVPLYVRATLEERSVTLNGALTPNRSVGFSTGAIIDSARWLLLHTNLENDVNNPSGVYFATHEHSAMVSSNEKISFHLCLTYSDTGTSSGVDLRIRHILNDSKIYYSARYGHTWSGSRLYHHRCGQWSGIDNLNLCSTGWGSTCVIEVKHSQAGHNAMISNAYIEIVAKQEA
ncbi:MAG: hypothetical protein HQK50_01060 [Oligoflexia bacterium]|nr:hypothetical protein [Oligoflexia bacterium]